jgi:argininosuccinate lyase
MVQRVLERIRIDPERMRNSTSKGYLNATELADYLVSKKMPFRKAHMLVGKIVVRASELGKALEELPMREFQSFSPLFDDDLYGWLKLERGLSRRREQGGTAPASVKKAIKDFRERIQKG